MIQFDMQTCPLYVEDGEEALSSVIDMQQLRAKHEILVRHCTSAAHGPLACCCKSMLLSGNHCAVYDYNPRNLCACCSREVSCRTMYSDGGTALSHSWRHGPKSCQCPQAHVDRLREGFESCSREAAHAAEERLATAVAAKQAELDAVSQQLQAERSQHRTAQAGLDRPA